MLESEFAYVHLSSKKWSKEISPFKLNSGGAEAGNHGNQRFLINSWSVFASCAQSCLLSVSLTVSLCRFICAFTSTRLQLTTYRQMCCSNEHHTVISIRYQMVTHIYSYRLNRKKRYDKVSNNKYFFLQYCE